MAEAARPFEYEEYEFKPFHLYDAVKERLTEIDAALVPHPQQIGGFDGLTAVGAALLAAVGAHSVVESVYLGGRVERLCWTCPDRPAYPCPEHREVAQALGIEIIDGVWVRA